MQRGVAFLEASARPDGSWPVDTNLATWLTTLSLQALGAADAGSSALPASEQSRALRDWLLRQQYRAEHPYTLAAPGGWAWTDLPGGVPDADDTAGALLALDRLGPEDPAVHEAVAAGLTWLLDLQNRDGGTPTFCRGWGQLAFDRSSPDLTAHAIRAWTAWRDRMPPPLQRRLDRALAQAVGFLRKTQRGDGAWIPLWFGHQEDPADENPLYGTSRVVPALCRLEKSERSEVGRPLDRAVHWLVTRQNPDGGWSGAPGAASSTEESGLALEALAAAWEHREVNPAGRPALQAALTRGAAWLVAAVENDRWREPAPIGFYFARLWYFERLYPLIFATGALVRLTNLR